MASVKLHRDGRVAVSISIAEPLQIILVPCGCLPVLTVILTIMFIQGLAAGRVSPAQMLSFGGPLLVALAASVLIVLLFVQTWELDPVGRRIICRRVGIIVRTSPLEGLTHLRLDRTGGEDDAGRAILVYASGEESPINRTNSASIKELETLVEAFNDALSRMNRSGSARPSYAGRS